MNITLTFLLKMFDIYSQNTWGIRTKTDDINSQILHNNYRVIVFTETWLNSNIHDNKFIDTRYT